MKGQHDILSASWLRRFIRKTFCQDRPSLDVLSGRHIVRTALDVLWGRHFVRIGHYFSTTSALLGEYLGTTWVLLWHYLSNASVLLGPFDTNWTILEHYLGAALTLIGQYLGTTRVPLLHYFVNTLAISGHIINYKKVPESTRRNQKTRPNILYMTHQMSRKNRNYLDGSI